MADCLILDRVTHKARQVLDRSQQAAKGGVLRPESFLSFLDFEAETRLPLEVIREAGVEWEWSKEPVRLFELLEVAYDEARRLGHPYVGTEHLFLGLVRLRSVPNIAEARSEISKLTFLPTGFVSEDQIALTPLLDTFGVDLSELARRGQLEPVVGRGEVTSRLIRTLLRQGKCHPVLVGDSGVGKTAIIRDLVLSIHSSRVPASLLAKKVFSFDLARFLTSYGRHGGSLTVFSSFLDEVSSVGNIILCFDELGDLLGGSVPVGVSLGLANILGERLSGNRCQVLMVSQSKDYQRCLELVPGLIRQLEPVLIEEPAISETEAILGGVVSDLGRFHRVKYDPKAIREAIFLSQHYLRDQRLPRKAIDVLDESGAWVRAKQERVSVALRKKLDTYRKLPGTLTQALEDRNLDRALELRSERDVLRGRLKRLASKKGVAVVDKQAVAAVVSKRTGVPLVRLEGSEAEKFRGIEDFLAQRVIGQRQAISVLSQALRRSRAGLGDLRRPIGSFLFLGPTGVGKTELARALADFLFGSSSKLFRFDMSEFRERHATARLVGSPPGYVGYDKGGELTEKVRDDPYCVVLFDEMEKAHPEVLNLLLQIMEEGELSDGQGRVTSFNNAVVILTSNAGADLLRRSDLGFSGVGIPTSSGDDVAYKSIRGRLLENLKKGVRPEFLNRLSEIVVFRPLSFDDVLEIVELRLKELTEKASSRGYQLRFTSAAKQALAKKGFSEEYGARHVRRVLESEVEGPLSELIVRAEVTEGDEVLVRLRKGAIKLCPM